MQWRNYQDMGVENFGGMPLAASSYNPYWAGGMPMGMDPYMAAPLAGAMPFMGYAPGPFDVPFGGAILPQDPFVAPGYMMPAVPRYCVVLVLMKPWKLTRSLKKKTVGWHFHFIIMEYGFSSGYSTSPVSLLLPFFCMIQDVFFLSPVTFISVLCSFFFQVH